MVEKLINSKWAKFWFALSVAAFVGLQIRMGNVFVMALNIFAAFALAIFVECKYAISSKLLEAKSKKHALIALLIAIYTVIEMVLGFYSQKIARVFADEYHPFAVELRGFLPEQIFGFEIHTVLVVFIAIAGMIALPAIFVVAYAITSHFKNFAAKVWRGTEQHERVYFVATVSIFGLFVAAAYSLSPIFWGSNELPNYGFDFFFGLDVGYAIHLDGQFITTASARITRLFFPLVNFPFALIARMLSRILFFVPFAYVYFLQLFHICLMACGGILLARMCNIVGFSKKCFLALYSVSYSFLVFSIPPERYVLPTFCIILFIYVCARFPKAKYVAAIVAAGTLTTNLAVFPFVAYAKKFKQWFFNLVKLGCGFVAACILGGILIRLFDPVQAILGELDRFAGGIDPRERILQFINFVGSIFIRPETTLAYGTDQHGMDVIRYVLAVPTSVNWIGILLIMLAIAGFILNRKLRFAQISLLWAAYAFLILFVIGWQARGNEMFLSAFYFGWAFFVLAFLLVEKLLEKQKAIKYLAYSAVFVAMAIINISGIIELIRFGIQHYPAR